MRKTTILVIMLACLQQACSQNSKKTNDMTIEEMIESTLKSVQRYDEEPVYMAQVESNACFIIKTNDAPMLSFFGPPTDPITFHINKQILKSGPQEMNIEIYPEYIDRATQKDTLHNNVQFKLIVMKRYWIKDMGLSDPEIVAIYDLQKKRKEYSINLTAKKEYKDTLRFKAEVPYTLTGWTKSKNLTKMNRKELEKKVVAFYKRYHSWYSNKEAYPIQKTLYKRGLETSQAAYLNRDEITRKKTGSDRFFSKEEYEMIPLENYEIQFFGNGRMVALIRTDRRNRGESALRYRYVNDMGMRRICMADLFLHIPEDGTELEVIR